MNTVRRTQGRYYWGEKEEQACYYFEFRDDAPDNLQRNFIIRLEHDYSWDGSPFEVRKVGKARSNRCTKRGTGYVI